MKPIPSPSIAEINQFWDHINWELLIKIIDIKTNR